MGKNRYGICTSPETATKQKHFVGILDILMPVAKRSMARWRNGNPYFWIYDLNAARSEYVDEDTGERIIGSAVLGVTRARQYGLNYRAVLCELRADNAADLQRHFVLDNKVTVLQGDNEITLPPTLPGYFGAERFGYVYADPNDARLPIDMLADMFSRQPFNRTDLIVNIAAASLKRMILNENYDDIALDSLLARVNKKTWLVREPHAKHQWSLLVGTNWADAPEWKNAGFYRMDTDKGAMVWKQLAKTKRQLMKEMQPSIFS
jgi:hypothetical protein